MFSWMRKFLSKKMTPSTFKGQQSLTENRPNGCKCTNELELPYLFPDQKKSVSSDFFFFL